MNATESDRAQAVGRKLIDVHDVAGRTGFSWRTVYRYADAGLMPAGFRIGGRRVWSLDEIDSWIKGGCKPVR